VVNDIVKQDRQRERRKTAREVAAAMHTNRESSSHDTPDLIPTHIAS
jgi:hypothetical protein